MVRLRKSAAFIRCGVLVSASLITVAWAPNIGAQTNPSIEQSTAVSSQWSRDAVGQLIQLIDAARGEGLNPADYRTADLRRAAEGGEGAALDATANAAAYALAHDYYFGRVANRDGYLIPRAPYEEALLKERMTKAIADRTLKSFYTSLLPTDERYGALREALADTSDAAMRDKLRANMERWRWMPRGLGDSYIYVNVPSYQLRVIDSGTSVATYDVVVGAKATPTPWLVSPSSSLVVNPSWYVPASIIKSSNLYRGKAGYIFEGKSVRQAPGPRNALGKIKFNLVNDQAIYLHDTPAKAGFTRTDRALSHGCIRVKDIDQLAFQLMDGKDAGQLDEAMADTRTATLKLPKTWQVYIVYFTADSVEGGSVVSYNDPYGHDARIVAQLDGRPLDSGKPLGGGSGRQIARR